MRRITTTSTLAALLVGASAVVACVGAPEDNLGSGSHLTDKDGAKGSAKGLTAKSTLPCAVTAVLTKRCQTCHGATPASGAATSLVTWDDLQADHGGKKIVDLVATRIHATSNPMPPSATLDASEIASIDAWIAAGANRANEQCQVAAPPPATQPFECPAPAKTTVIKSPEPFTWSGDPGDDQYVCFGLDESVSTKRHATLLGPIVDNPAIVHHVALFQTKDAFSSSPQPCSASTAATWKWVAHWAPGGGNLELPPEAGYPVSGTTHWALQIHYNNARNLAGQSDNSGYRICETEQLRPNDAGILAFGGLRFSIPPRSSSFTLRCDYELGDDYAGRTFFGAIPHMHELGRAIGTQRLPRGGGPPQMVFEQNPFSFESQGVFKLDDIHVSPGDVMRTRCTWANPTDRTVGFGENTSDEMCFNFLAYYPAIEDRSIGPVPVQSWETPSMNVPLIGGADCSVE